MRQAEITKSRFQQVLAKHESIVADLIRLLPRSAKGNDREAWTAAVKEVMHCLFKRYLEEGPGGPFDHEYCATLPDGGHHEWLLDVLWYYRTPDEESALLGLESEWAIPGREVESDFCKVLALKTPLKLMLFQSSKGGSRTNDKVIGELNCLGKRWSQHTRDDLIYVIDFSRGGYSTHFYRVRKDCKDPHFNLTRFMYKDERYWKEESK